MVADDTRQGPDPQRGSPAGSAPAAAAKKPKRRRWLRRAAIVLGLLVLLGWLSPYLLSTGPGTQLILSIVNTQLDGKVAMTDLSLSWLGPCTVTGLSVHDPSGREVLHTEQIRYAGGLLRAALSPGQFKEIVVDGPRATLYLTPDGSISLAKVVRPRAKPRRRPKPLPKLTGSLRLRDATVTIVQLDGRKYEIPKITVLLDVNTLNEIDGSMQIATAGGGELVGQVKMRGLAPGAAIRLDQAVGNVTLETREDIDLAPVGRFAMDGPLAGKVGVDLAADLAPGRTELRFALRVAGLEARRLVKQQAKPIDLTLDGHFARSLAEAARRRYEGAVRLTARSETVETTFAYTEPGDQKPPALAEHLATVLAGRGAALPDFAFAAKGNVDIAAIAQAVPGLLRIREDVQVTGGSLKIDRLAVQGGPEPKASGAIHLSVLTSPRAGGTAGGEKRQSLSASFDMHIEPNEGLTITDAAVEAPFGKLTAAGSRRRLGLSVEGDLDKLRDSLDSIFDLQGLALAGRVEGAVQTSQQQDDAEQIEMRLTVRDLAYERGQTKLRLAEATFTNEGPIRLANQRPARLDLAMQASARDLSYARGGPTIRAQQVAFANRGPLVFNEDQSVDLEVSAEASAGGLCYEEPNRTIELEKVAWRTEGSLALRARRPAKLTCTAVRLEVDKAVALDASGWCDFEQGAFRGEIDSLQCDVAELAGRLRALGGDRLQSWAGAVTIRTAVGRQQRDGPITSSGNISLRGLKVKGEPLDTEDIRLAWSDASFWPRAEKVQLASAGLKSSFATADVKDLRCTLGKQADLVGQASLSTDLEKLLTVIGEATGRRNLPSVAGLLAWSGQAGTTGQVITVEGAGGVQDLRIGAQAVAQQRLDLACNVQVDLAAKRIDLKQLRVGPETAGPEDLFSLQLAGQVTQYETERQLNLTGRFSGSGDKLTALLHELSPGTVQTVSMSGPTEGTLEITGPVYRPTVRPVFKDAHGRAGMGWAKLSAYGLNLGRAELRPELRDGQVKLPTAEIEANRGKLRLGADVDFRGDQPTLLIPGRLQILDNVEINPELSKHLLSRVNPIFGDLAGVEGQVGLRVNDVSLPLSEALKTQGSAQGHLDLSELRIQPKGLLSALLKLGGMGDEKAQPVKVSGLDFLVKDGRVTYDNFTMIFGGVFDLRFRGSVGFDDTVDMVVSIPVRPELLERFGITGPIAEYARVLAGTRVEIPIKGTRSKPRLDLTEVDVTKLIRKAVELLLSERARESLEKILTPGKPKQPAEDEGKAPKQEGPAKQLLDWLLETATDRDRDAKGKKDESDASP